MKNWKTLLPTFLAGLALAIAGVALTQSPIFNIFEPPASGSVMLSNGSYNPGAAAASNIIGLWSGPCNSSTVLSGGGTCINPSSTPCTFAAPSAQVGLTAVTGSTGDCMDAGSAPALSQSIAPTWTHEHIWSVSTDPAISLVGPSGVVLYWGNGTVTGELLTNSSSAQIGTQGNYPICLYVDFGNCALEVQTGATDGTVQVVDSAGNLFNAGYLNCPYNIQSSNYTVAISDRDKCVRVNTSSVTISLPCSGTFALGDVVSIVVGASETATLTASSGTLYWANGTTTSGNRTVTGIAIATVAFDGSSGTTSSDCLVTGSGIS